MTDLLAMSSAVIDGTQTPENIGPMNRINFELSVVGDNIAMVEAFSHCVLFETDDGLVAFDTSGPKGGELVVEAIRKWRKNPFNSLIYTHGHIDHVGGCGAFIRDSEAKQQEKPEIIGHSNIEKRFDRYKLTNGYNQVINKRQFGQFSRRGYQIQDGEDFLPNSSLSPNLTYEESLDLDIGGLKIELKHAKGETDDHTWAWMPQQKAICAGDFFIWCFPNAGNPQKVQRYPAEWAKAMRSMAQKGAELFMPAHGLPIAGASRIKKVLTDVAESLEFLVRETLLRMNEGARLSDIIHEVKIDPSVLEKPYLKPLYDEPEFVIRNIWRLYGGWYDGNPANLKPAPDTELAMELALLAGGALKLAERGHELMSSDPRLACHLAEFAAQANPDAPEIHQIRAEIYQNRRTMETSLMSKGIYGSAAKESLDKLDTNEK